MSAEQTLYDALRTDPILSSMVDGRIYPDFLPDVVDRPALVYHRTSTTYFPTLDSIMDVERAEFDVMCIANTRSGAEACANAASDALIIAGIMPSARSHEYDPESGASITILSVVVWTQGG